MNERRRLLISWLTALKTWSSSKLLRDVIIVTSDPIQFDDLTNAWTNSETEALPKFSKSSF